MSQALLPNLLYFPLYLTLLKGLTFCLERGPEAVQVGVLNPFSECRKGKGHLG